MPIDYHYGSIGAFKPSHQAFSLTLTSTRFGLLFDPLRLNRPLGYFDLVLLTCPYPIPTLFDSVPLTSPGSSWNFDPILVPNQLIIQCSLPPVPSFLAF